MQWWTVGLVANAFISLAVMAVYYFGLRRPYRPLRRDAQRFEDLRKREQQTLELNDNVLQGLVIAKMALDLDQRDKAMEALRSSISAASTIITGHLGAEDRPVCAGLVRSSAAILEASEGPASVAPTCGTARTP